MDSETELRARAERNLQRYHDEYDPLSDEEIMALIITSTTHTSAQMELSRRGIVATRDLGASIDRFERTSAKLTKWLIGWTVLLALLTVALFVRAVWW